MTTTLKSLVLDQEPDFIVIEDGVPYLTNWNYFNPNNRTSPKVIDEGTNIDGLLSIDLDELDFPIITWEDLSSIVEALNKRIAANLPFAHFNIRIPAFLYRMALGLHLFENNKAKYLNDIATSQDPMVMVAVSMVLMEEKKKKIQKEYGFSVNGVFSTTAGEPSFAYTCELGSINDGELILVAPIKTEEIHQIINSVVLHNRSIGKLNNTVFSSPDFKLHSGETLRLKVVQVTNDQARMRYGKLYPLYQLFIGDKNNLLPGEDGYDVNFKQDIKHTL